MIPATKQRWRSSNSKQTAPSTHSRQGSPSARRSHRGSSGAFHFPLPNQGFDHEQSIAAPNPDVGTQSAAAIVHSLHAAMRQPYSPHRPVSTTAHDSPSRGVLPKRSNYIYLSENKINKNTFPNK